MKVHIQGLLCI